MQKGMMMWRGVELHFRVCVIARLCRNYFQKLYRAIKSVQVAMYGS